MRYLVIILFIITTAGCLSNKYYTAYLPHLDSKTEGNNFIDSLRTEGVDTIVGYYDGCSGCIPGLDKPYFVYWLDGNHWYLTKFSRYSNFNYLKGYSPPMNYLTSVIDDLKDEKLKDEFGEMSHFPFDEIRLKIGEYEIKYSITFSLKAQNEMSKKVVLIDKIKADLFDIIDGEWRGKNYKKEKRKKESA